MRKMVVALSALTVAGAALVGCSSRAAEHAAASKDLHSALAIMAKANRGYAADKGHSRTDLQAYRQQTLKEAVAPLQDVIKRGSDVQQVTAATLLAQIQLSQAQYLARAARGQYGQLLAGSGVIVSDAVGVDAAAGRVRLLDIDNSAGVTQLETALNDLTQRQAKLHKLVQTQQHAAAAQKKQADTLQSQANDLMQKAQQIHAKGFVSHGDKKYDLYDQAAKVQSKAKAASFQAERHQVKQNIHAQKLAYVKSKWQLTSAGIDLVQKRIAGLKDQQQKMTASRQQAMQQQQQAAQKVGQAFTQLQNAYQGAVTGPYTQAEQHATQAINVLTTARPRARDESADVQLALLSGRVDQVQILMAHARAAKGYADLLALVAVGAPARTPAVSGSLTQALTQARAQQTALASEAAKAAGAGLKITGQLTHQRQNIASIAKSQQALLQQYQTAAQNLAQS